MWRIVVDRIFRHAPALLLIERFARVWVHIEAWKVATRNIQADVMATSTKLTPLIQKLWLRRPGGLLDYIQPRFPWIGTGDRRIASVTR